MHIEMEVKRIEAGTVTYVTGCPTIEIRGTQQRGDGVLVKLTLPNQPGAWLEAMSALDKIRGGLQEAFESHREVA